MLAVAPTAMTNSGLAAVPEPGQPADVAGAGGVVDDADDHEQRRLEHRVRAQHGQPGQHQVAAAGADHHGDQAELAHRAEREDQLEVVFAHRAPAGQQHRSARRAMTTIGRHGGASANPGVIRATR